MNNPRHHNDGFITTIILIVIALIILGYYNINIKTIFASPIVKDNLLYGLSVALQGIKYGTHIIIQTITDNLPFIKTLLGYIKNVFK